MKMSLFVSTGSIFPIYYHTYQQQHKDEIINLITQPNSIAEDRRLCKS